MFAFFHTHETDEALYRKVYPGDNKEIPGDFLAFVGHFFLNKTNLVYWPFMAGASIIFSATSLALSFAIGDIVKIAQSAENLTVQSFYGVIAFTLTLLFVRIFATSAQFVFWILLRRDIEITIKARLYAYLQRHAHDYFLTHPAGNTALKISEVPRSTVEFVARFLFEGVEILATFVLTAIFLYSIDPALCLAASVWSIIFVTVSYFLSKRAKTLSSDWATARGQTAGQIVDTIVNNTSMRSFARFVYERHNLIPFLRLERKRWLKGEVFTLFFSFFRDVSSFAFTAFILFFITHEIVQGRLSSADLAVALSLMFVAIQKVNSLQYVMKDMATHAGTIIEGCGLLLRTQEVQDKPDAVPFEMTQADIKFSQVYFNYKGKKQVFEDFSLEIPQGQKLGIMGPSGAGKSSLITLALRFYDIQSGTIEISGQNIQDVTQDSLREHIAVIPQDTALFHRSLMDNIRYGLVEACNEEVIEAARKAHAHDFIAELPDGYDTLVGERGVRLSGGQRQRIAIARAILQNAPILILDEATSALDSQSEKLIQESLKDLMEGKTVIAIAHRLSTISHLDRLIVMNEGKIIEDGTHEQLLGMEDGLYKKLWGMQSGGFVGL